MNGDEHDAVNWPNSCNPNNHHSLSHADDLIVHHHPSFLVDDVPMLDNLTPTRWVFFEHISFACRSPAGESRFKERKWSGTLLTSCLLKSVTEKWEEISTIADRNRNRTLPEDSSHSLYVILLRTDLFPVVMMFVRPTWAHLFFDW